MTEQEWLTSEDPVAMLDYVTCRAGNVPLARPEHLPSDRKLRLFACACCRQERPLRTAVLRAVVLAERFADGGWDRDEAAAALDMSDPEYRLCWTLANGLAPDAALTALDKYVRSRASQAALLRDVVGNPWRPVRLPRDICAVCLGAGASPDMSPCDACRTSGYTSAWLTPDVLAIAQAAYDDRGEGGFLKAEHLGPLADALEDVGCDSVELLAHLRGGGSTDADPTPWEHRERSDHDAGRMAAEFDLRLRPRPHVRGCWALDLILGRE
jgi:hypothetical protein